MYMCVIYARRITAANYKEAHYLFLQNDMLALPVLHHTESL